MATRDEIKKEQYEAIKAAFDAAIAEIKSHYQLRGVATQLDMLIENQDIDGIMRLLGINEAAFSEVAEAVSRSFAAGGRYMSGQIGVIPITGVGSVIPRFDMRAPSVDEWVRKTLAEMVTQTVEDQREAIRNTIKTGTELGINPRQQAYNIVGQLTKSGTRQGGIVGMTSQQAGWMRNAAAEIDDLDPNYLSRALRDKRFDAEFKRALEAKEPLSAKMKSAMLRSLEQNTVQYRGETIARTESINALRAGSHNAMQQAVDRGDLKASDIEKTWASTGRDGRTRESHLALDGQTVAFNGFFRAKGGKLAYPGDRSHGASASETIDCRCQVRYRIDYLSKELRGFD